MELWMATQLPKASLPGDLQALTDDPLGGGVTDLNLH